LTRAAVVAPRNPVLERVPLLAKELDDYAEVVEPGTIERLRALAEPLRGARVLHVNATAYGGGVAELLATHVALLRSVGVEADWQVMSGSDEFFAVTKTVHNGLQGADVEWTPAMQRIYLERVLDNALNFDGDWDYVVMHDPQPAAMRELLRDRKATDAKWVWRSILRMQTQLFGTSSARSSSSTTPVCSPCRSSFPAVSTRPASFTHRRASTHSR
jgi:trehalose synthase